MKVLCPESSHLVWSFNRLYTVCFERMTTNEPQARKNKVHTGLFQCKWVVVRSRPTLDGHGAHSEHELPRIHTLKRSHTYSAHTWPNTELHAVYTIKCLCFPSSWHASSVPWEHSWWVLCMTLSRGSNETCGFCHSVSLERHLRVACILNAAYR